MKPNEKRNSIKTIIIMDTSCSSGCAHCFCGNRSGNIDNARKIATEIAESPDYKGILYPTLFSNACFDIHEILGQTGGLISREKRFITDDTRIAKYKTVEISLHGADAETHALLTRKTDSFFKVLQTIKECKTNFPSVQIHALCTVHKKNFQELDKIAELCMKIGVNYLNFIKLSYLGQARQLGSEWYLDKKDIRHVVKMVERLESQCRGALNVTMMSNWGMSESFADGIKKLSHASGAEKDELQLKYWWAEAVCCSPKIEEHENWYTHFRCCPAGREQIAVHTDSRKIYPCHLFIADDRFVLGSWRNARPEITYSPFDKLYEKIAEPCQSCNILEICGGGCRGEAIAEKERISGRLDPYAGMENCRRFI